MQLSPQQAEACKLIFDWQRSHEKNHFVLSGYAGTGKTTLAKYIADTLGQENVAFCAYTGKAASVLRDKGCVNSGTIHSFLYKYEEQRAGKPIFRKLDKTECQFRFKKLVICDEYSMLSSEIISDLLSVSKKILFLGDNFQLPPVSGECPLKPDYMMTEIQRQALDSGIIRAATKVRIEGRLSYIEESDFVYSPKTKIPEQTYYDVDQTIVGKNRTRVKWNGVFRKKLISGEIIDNWPQIGEKVICLRNNRDFKIYNGFIGNVTDYDDYEEKLSLSSGDIHFYDLPVANIAWMKDKPDLHDVPRDFCIFDYAYAITCHKSQGSEFDTVLINNETFGDTDELRRRWTYTAITRGRNKVYLMDPNA